MSYQDTYDDDLHEDDAAEAAFNRCPYCAPIIAIVSAAIFGASIYFAPFLTLAFAAGVLTAVVILPSEKPTEASK